MKKAIQLIDIEKEKLIQDLQLHQLELEIQNQELILAKESAELSTRKFTELYDFAPCGYFTLSKNGEIIELNLCGSQMLGKEGKYLINCMFGIFVSLPDRPVFNAFLDKLFEGKAKETCTVKMQSDNHSVLDVHLTGILDQKQELCMITAVDFTELKQNQLFEHESQARLDKTQKIAHLGSWELDLQSRVLIWSEEVYRIFGMSPHEFGNTYNAFIGLVHPEDRDGLESAYFNSIEQDNNGFELEHRIICPNSGEIRFVFEKCEHIRDASGKIVRSVGMVQDITERKQAQIALLENEEKFRSFISYSSDPIFSFNTDETYRFVNEAFARPFGKSPSEIMGKTPHAIFPYDEAEKRLAIVRKVFQTGEKGELEAKVVTPSGGIRYYLTSADPVKNDQGQVININCVSKEFTQLKHTEQALKDSEAQLAAILAAIPDMIFIQDKEGFFLDYHGPVDTELLVSPEKFIGKNMREVLPPDIVAQFAKVFEEAFRTKQVQLYEYSMLLPVGLKYFESKLVVYDDDKILTIARNVSPYKEAEKLIKQKNSDLQAINAEKDKFFSIIAHDLRSPFSGFLGLTDFMSRNLSNMTLAEIQQITTLMQTSATHLFRLLGNLLEWSSMQRGLITFVPKTFLLKQKIDAGLFSYKEMASKKGVELSCKVNGQLKVFADENMLGSILGNLLSNGVKFTPKGGKVAIFTKRESVGSLRILVRDTGIGMNKNQIDNLFRLDRQSCRKGTDGEYSSGLGLIICKDFIDKHGWKLRIDSEVGKGTTFSISLPLQKEK